MKKVLLLSFLTIFTFSLHGQKQITPYFEFSYNCSNVSSDYDSNRKSWSYLYEDNVNDLIITIDVKINPRNEEYPRELLDGMVMNSGSLKVVIGSFNGIYAAITTGQEQGYFMKMATFNTKKKAFVVSVITSDKEALSRRFSQIEKSFITKN